MNWRFQLYNCRNIWLIEIVVIFNLYNCRKWTQHECRSRSGYFKSSVPQTSLFRQDVQILCNVLFYAGNVTCGQEWFHQGLWPLALLGFWVIFFELLVLKLSFIIFTSLFSSKETGDRSWLLQIVPSVLSFGKHYSNLPRRLTLNKSIPAKRLSSNT